MPKTAKMSQNLLVPDKYIGFPFIVGTKAVKVISDQKDESSIIYDWEFYIRSVYLLPSVYGYTNFSFTQPSSKYVPSINTLQFIEKVTITLHNSFAQPNIEITFEEIKNTSDGNEFVHKNRGWGEFEIRATLYLKNNKQIKVAHYLRLHAQALDARIIPDHLNIDQPKEVVISERLDTIILRNPPHNLLHNWNMLYSDMSCFNLNMRIDEEENTSKNLPGLSAWFRNKNYGKQEENKIDDAIKYILEKIENIDQIENE